MKKINAETLKKKLKGGKCGNARLTMPAIYHLTVKTASDPELLSLDKIYKFVYYLKYD